ncbi:hypothetical protein [Kineosporia babensis]|uniref:Uncharacterized protein n=1 Tax=Kineosporia babensis TaxID=499548 RepID=A0A9X1NL88_9ACTN|nr:hypothetical protein [Kineosporia babensis]MCD5316160.1 hypothetical protein [Kineosporia babensis]
MTYAMTPSPSAQATKDNLPAWEDDAAYWAGFLMADGTISTTNRITLSLAAKDEGHIAAWLEFLGCLQVKIRIESVRFSNDAPEKMKARAQVSSRQLAEDLARHGIVHRKSSAGLPASASLAENAAFWRGMIDGDGTLGLPKGKHGPILMLVGSLAVMEQFADFLHHVIGGKKPNVLAVHGTSVIVQVRVNGVRTREAIHVLWDGVFDARQSPALDRKSQRASEAMTWRTRTEIEQAMGNEGARSVGR